MSERPLRPGRTEATVTEVHEHHAFALDEFGVRYFLYRGGFEQSNPAGFEDLRIGSIVHLTAIDHPRGQRGIEILIVRT